MLDVQDCTLEQLQTHLIAIADLLQTPLCTQLSTLHANESLTVTEAGILQLNHEPDAPWMRLPPDWRVWIEQLEELPSEEQQALLCKLALSPLDLAELPPSLINFFEQCRSLSLERTPRNSSYASHSQLATGMSPKKNHEVDSLVSLIQETWPTALLRPSHAIDLGSGRAHLSRALTRPPLNMHVLAVDFSASQLAGADKLDLLCAKQGSSGGSLVHRLQRLESAADIELLVEGYGAQTENSRSHPPLALGLHACGDLSVCILRAFSASIAGKASLILVSCCYNLLSPSNINLSGIAPVALAPTQLMLATQSPVSWAISVPRAYFSIQKLWYRARLAAELSHSVKDRQLSRLGRLKDGVYESYGTYRAVALRKLGLAEEMPPAANTPPHLIFRFACLWTIRTHLGPLIESYILLDRYLHLAATHGKAQTQLRPVFDQLSGSLRNMAFIVRLREEAEGEEDNSQGSKGPGSDGVGDQHSQ